MSSHRNRFRPRKPRKPGWLKMPKKPARKAADCAPDLDCGDCDCGGCDLTLFGFFVAAMCYFVTPPVREGNPTLRPALRLIRSYQRNVSTHRPAVCNLTPTCSRFGYETLRDTGWRGVRTVRQRLTECKTTGQANRAQKDHS